MASTGQFCLRKFLHHPDHSESATHLQSLIVPKMPKNACRLDFSWFVGKFLTKTVRDILSLAWLGSALEVSCCAVRVAPDTGGSLMADSLPLDFLLGCSISSSEVSLSSLSWTPASWCERFCPLWAPSYTQRVVLNRESTVARIKSDVDEHLLCLPRQKTFSSSLQDLLAWNVKQRW